MRQEQAGEPSGSGETHRPAVPGPVSAPSASLVQPIIAGILAAIVGFGSSFAVLLQGLRSVGASQAEAASGLMAVTIGMAALSVVLTVRARLPITIAWTTPGSALLVATPLPAGGFSEAVGAFIMTGILIVAAGLWKPFGRAVAAIPLPLASAMLAGVLLNLCLAPMKAVGAMPLLALPIVVAWALAWRFARLWAVPIAVTVCAVMVGISTPMPEGALAHALAKPILIVPSFTAEGFISIAVPLFIVTMASQNLPGLAVLQANGYRPAPSPLFVATGLGSVVVAPLGGLTINLAAITSALCCGPEAHPDPAKRWVATVSNGLSYMVLGPLAGIAALFIAASPPLLIEAVAGLALLGTLATALAAAMAREADRIPAVITFVTAASGLTFFGIGAAFWGLMAGIALSALARWHPRAG